MPRTGLKAAARRLAESALRNNAKANKPKSVPPETRSAAAAAVVPNTSNGAGVLEATTAPTTTPTVPRNVEPSVPPMSGQ